MPAPDAPGDPRHRVPRPPGAPLRFDDQRPLTLVLVRHGVTEHTLTGAYSGGSEPGPPLAGHGRIQAARAADLVHRIGRQLWQDLPHPTAVVASPMVRTQETAAAVGRRLGQPVATDERLAECVFGDWQGLTAAEVEARWPGELRRWHESGTARPPGGESFVDVGGRAWSAVQDLLAAGTGRTVVAVSHAVAIRSIVGTALGTDPGRWQLLRVAPCSVSILNLWPDGAVEVTALGVLQET